MHVHLVVNWFESHRVVGPIHTAFLEYKQSSKLRYVDANATVAIIGPTELANRWSVDELTLVRAQQKIFYQSVQDTAKSQSRRSYCPVFSIHRKRMVFSLRRPTQSAN
jgi:hypothetical protein